MEIIQHLTFVIGLIAAVTAGLTEVIKQATVIDDNKMPLVAIVVGLALGGLAIMITDFTVGELIWAGLIGGLASMGLFDVVKKVGED